MKIRMTLLFLCVLLVSSVFAIDVPTPEGYTPWFSVDLGGWTGTNPIVCVPASESLPDDRVVTVVAVASNLTHVGEVSEPSIECLIRPIGASEVVPGWTGCVKVKKAVGPIRISLAPATGTVTRYSFYTKVTDPHGACGKAGKPVLVSP